MQKESLVCCLLPKCSLLCPDFSSKAVLRGGTVEQQPPALDASKNWGCLATEKQ